MKYFILIIVTAFFFACKEEPRELEVCFQIDENVINQGDSILFTNCSIADTTIIVIENTNNGQTYNGPAYNFINDSIYITFSDTGSFVAIVKAWNFQHDSELKEYYRSVRVN